MKQTIGIGIQDFEKIRTRNIFYIDKTDFIREWWESEDDVTLITRPRRFGKTLNISMTEQFFSLNYAGRSDLFEGLSIWEKEAYRNLQGTYPVISLSFAGIKENTYQKTFERFCQILSKLYTKFDFIKNSEKLTDNERMFFDRIEGCNVPETEAAGALHNLSDFLARYYGKKVIILLDEYDTPMQEAYVYGFWEELVTFTRNLFHAAFKTNPYLERGMLIGILVEAPSPLGSKKPHQVDEVGFPAKFEKTSLSSQCHSMFSDLNNLKVVTTTTDKYTDAFGFTEEEVFAKLDDFGMSEKKEKVKFWYDGFTFGSQSDIYNPWSIINFLDTGRFDAYWANTSSNNLAGKLIREGSPDLKMTMEELLKGNSLFTEIDEQIVFDQLDTDESSVWSLFLASGYLKVNQFDKSENEYGEWEEKYELAITNYETLRMFRKIVQGWFKRSTAPYNDFIKALLAGDVDAMDYYMNKVALNTFSSFDVGNKPSESAEPERFYHGFVLGLIVDLAGRYTITSNRESGFGRYDVMLEPCNKADHAYILEFKVYDSKREKSLEDTVVSALEQIKEKQYAKSLQQKGIPKERIREYGFAFEGKKVLIASDKR